MRNFIYKITALLGLLIFPSTSFAAHVYFYDTDNVGTPVAMWSAGGKKLWEAEYYPFAEEFNVREIPNSNKKRLIGKDKDEETELTYFGARYMDETTGRFLSPDPVRAVDGRTSQTNYDLLTEPQRLNRYVYGLNNPYRYVDPDGREPHQWADGNYSDNDGQENPGLSAKVNKAYSQVGQGIAEGWQYSPALIVGTGLGGAARFAGGSLLPKIYGTQKGLRNPALVGTIKKSMLGGKFNFSSLKNRIGGYVDDAGKYYVGEGHHRMAAAREIFKETGNSGPVNQLLKNGRWTKTKRPPSTATSLPKRKKR